MRIPYTKKTLNTNAYVLLIALTLLGVFRIGQLDKTTSYVKYSEDHEPQTPIARLNGEVLGVSTISASASTSPFVIESTGLNRQDVLALIDQRLLGLPLSTTTIQNVVNYYGNGGGGSSQGAVDAFARSISSVQSSINSISQSQWTTSGSKISYNLGVVSIGNNLGIGTSTPDSKLTIVGDSGVIDNSVGPALTGRGSIHLVPESNTDGNSVGITFGSNDVYNSSPQTSVQAGILVQGSGNYGTRMYFSTSNGFNFTGARTRMMIDEAGNVGIGTTTPWRTFSVTGTVGFDGLTSSTGAGSLCLSSTKQVVYNSASDACLSSLRATKHDIATSSVDAIALVLKLDPATFVYNEGDGRTRYGFMAEDTALVDDHLATHDAEGNISGIDDRAILSVVVKAIKDLYNNIGELFDNYLSSHDVYIKDARVGNLKVDGNVCVDDTCITKDQFKSMLLNSGGNTAQSVPVPVAPVDDISTTTEIESISTTTSGI